MRLRIFISHFVIVVAIVLFVTIFSYSSLLIVLNSHTELISPDAITTLVEEYRPLLVYTGAGVVFVALIALMLLSRETLKPLNHLVEFSRKISTGEDAEKTPSLKDPDVAPIVAALERFHAQVAKDKTLDQNPLSGLPGNKSLYDDLFRRIEKKEPIAVGFIDANNFTAFNNRYGYERGDSVIRFMGTCALNAIKELGNKDDKFYHLGGDRYFFVSTPDKVKQICEKIIHDYDRQIVFFYDEEDQNRGYIVSEDKMGNKGEFAFMPICIGVATDTRRPLLHPLQIGHIGGEIRKFLRDRKKSDYLIDRRKTDREEEHEGKLAPFTREELEQVKMEIEELKRKEAAIVKAKQPVREITAEEISDTDTFNSEVSKSDGSKNSSVGQDGERKLET